MRTQGTRRLLVEHGFEVEAPHAGATAAAADPIVARTTPGDGPMQSKEEKR